MIKKQSTVKIAVLTFNRAEKLSILLKSLISQTYPNWEAIVFDNCSTDNTELTVSSLQDGRISYIKNEKNIGGCGNIEKAYNFCRANSDFFALLHDDDVLSPQWLYESLKLFLNDQAIVLAATNSWYLGRKPFQRRTFYKDTSGVVYLSDPKQLALWMMRNNSLCFPTILYKANAAPQIQFENKKTFDVKLYLEVATNGKCAVLLKPLFYYRVHPMQDSNYIPTVDIDWIDAILSQIIEPKNRCDFRVERDYLSRRWLQKYRAVAKSDTLLTRISRIRHALKNGRLSWSSYDGRHKIRILLTLGGL
jgi:glycosyltransferase involved in cell wall biosynthesis